jgi:hypothetical protein
MSQADELIPNVILHGEQSFEAAIDLIIGYAARELMVFDASLATGGYSSVRRAELLRNFLAETGSSRLTILLHDTDHLAYRCPRLMQLIRLYSHSITVLKTGEEAQVARDSFVLADGVHYLHRFHLDHARFRYGLDDAAAVHPLHERFEQIMETSTQGLSATTLGL